MMEIMCGDNRFEIIAKAKEHLLEGTNIDTSEDEMKVLDNFLFRCWQMGWLDRYAEQTEPNSSEKPNNCEELNAYRECVKSRSFWDNKRCDGCYFDERCPFDEPQAEPQTERSSE